jgi:uncharacterized SAM-binding protein YcdF (DUF218 family)
VGSLALLFVASTPRVARWPAWTLERQYPLVAVKSLPTADSIVVLAGSIAAMPRADGSIHVFARGASDWFETGLAACRAGKAPVIVFLSGDSGVPGAPAEGEWSRARAIELGASVQAAVSVDRALITPDESLNVAAKLKERGARTVILCTSATTCSAPQAISDASASTSSRCPAAPPPHGLRRAGR